MSAETHFEIERSSDNVNWLTIAIVAANTVTYTVQNAAGDITNYFRVRAIIKGVVQTALPMNSSYSNTDSCLCSYAVELNFKVERKLLSDVSWVEIVSLPADTESYNDTGRDPAATYNYRVRSYNSFGYSAYSNIVEIMCLFDAQLKSISKGLPYQYNVKHITGNKRF